MHCLELVLEMEREPETEANPTRPATRPKLVKVTCAWCGRVKRGNGFWQEEPAKKSARSVTHGICPECLASEMCAES